MKNVYKYLAVASVLGIATANLVAVTVPIGIPSAYLVLAGFGLEHSGADYIDKTRSNVYTYKGRDGTIQYGTSNPSQRKLAFISSCLGYSCIMGTLLGVTPLASSVLPLAAITCIFSTLGHLTYCKFVRKSQFKPAHLLISGIVTGILGLNLITSGSTLLMLGNLLQIENIGMSTYLGLLLYNISIGHDSMKAIKDVNNGKEDYLKHANTFSQNWLFALIPHLLMNM